MFFWSIQPYITICIYLQSHKDYLPLSRDQPTVEALDQVPPMLVEKHIEGSSDIPNFSFLLNDDSINLKVIIDFLKKNCSSNILHTEIFEGK